jgi:tRNA pseudouridine38-40 synthase
VPRIALLLEYSGKNFHGSQFQGGVRTVQHELEKAVSVLAKGDLRVHMSGRTDTGVNAGGQVAHFDFPQQLVSDQLDLHQMAWSLNGILPRDISVVDLQVVPETFHARYSATKRQYVYRILNRSQRSALLKDTHLHVRQPLSLKPMQDGASRLLGQHDFSAFRSSTTSNANPSCLIYRAELLNLREGELEFWIAADHFVYNMVRIIVGTLLEIGLGKRDAESVSQALEKRDRELAGPNAPPWGLTLDSVHYPEAFRLWEQKFQEILK